MKNQTGIAVSVIIIGLFLIGAIATFALVQVGKDDASKEEPNDTSSESNDDSASDQEEASTPNSDVEEDAEAKTVTITYTEDGIFSPSTVTINQGDTVKFVNDSNREIQPASGDHPDHDDYPGFESPSDIQPSGSWSFTFEQTGTWDYHDHNLETKSGVIIVL